MSSTLDPPANATSSSQAAGPLPQQAPHAQDAEAQGGAPEIAPVPTRDAQTPVPGAVSTDFIPRTQVRHRDRP